MSAYQIMQARIMLLDLYISHKIYGNAYDLCLIILESNPKAPVKKKLKQLESKYEENSDTFIYSCDLNIVDLSLCYNSNFNETSGTPSTNIAINIDADYDEEFENELEARLSKLDDISRSEFYRLRTHRKGDGVLSAKELDLLELESMERSYNYRKNKM